MGFPGVRYTFAAHRASVITPVTFIECNAYESLHLEFSRFPCPDCRMQASGGPHGVAGDATGQGASPRPRVELSLESPSGTAGGESGNKSSIQHNQHRSSVEFTLTFSFDASQVCMSFQSGKLT